MRILHPKEIGNGLRQVHTRILSDALAQASLDLDQNKVPKNLLVKEPSLSAQGIGGSCGR
jgi:hypothetical protein